MLISKRSNLLYYHLKEHLKFWISVMTLIVMAPSICWSFEDGAVAKVVSLSGDVLVKSHGASVFKSSGEYWRSKPRFLFPGDSMVTADDGEARILFSQGRGGIILTRNSRLVIKSVKSSGSSILTSITQFTHLLYQLVLSGETASDEAGAYFLNYDPATDIEVETNAVIAAIRGTSVGITIEANRINTVDVIEGDVEVTLRESGQKRKLSTGDQLITDGRRDRTLTVASIDAVQWTLQLPPLLKDRLTLPSTLGRTMLMAYDHLQNGRPTEAHELLSDEIKRGDKDSVELYWLSALIELVLDRKGAALVSAEKAIALDPEDPTALLTFSYVQQSRAKLREATELAHRAAVNAQNNREIDLAVLAWVNLAQLQFGSDDLVAAQNSLAMAQSLSSQDPSVHNLHGFLQLARGLTAQARTSFLAAIDIDEDFAEPYLGLSLVEIRHGNELAALEAIATAALLEPRRSLYMSYWAKIQYERKQYGKALRLLDLAKRFDSNDPTPYFYEALILRDQNKPSDAIKALQGAIDRNDRRAVYRSRFLLDRDLAVKTADLSQIYSQLGFDAWAKSEATKAIKQDITNPTAHIFLAGALENEQDRSLAQSSEALVSRLLQPGSINTFNSYNNYTTLLEQPSSNGNLSFSFGNHRLFSTQALVYGSIPSNHITYGAAATYFDDKGWRNNNGNSFQDVTGLIKWDPSFSSNFLASMSYSQVDFDDEQFPRFEIDFREDPVESTERQSVQFEIGYHSRFRPNSDLLFYASYENIKSLEFDHDPFRNFDDYFTRDIRQPFYQLQGQYSQKTDTHQFIIGALHYWGEIQLDGLKDARTVRPNGEITSRFFSQLNSDLDIYFQSYYIQDTWTADLEDSKWILEAALYLDWIEADFSSIENIMNTSPRTITSKESIRENQINPRFGIIWEPSPHDTLRFASYKYYVPYISSRLDATDVAGVTIYRNTIPGLRVQEFDLVWEHELSPNFLWDSGFFSTKIFYNESELETDLGDLKGQYQGVEADLNILFPGNGIGLVAHYSYTEIEEDSILQATSSNFSEKLTSIDRREHFLKLGLNYIGVDRLSAELNQIYRSINSIDESRPDEDISVTNLSFGYELSNKIGTIRFEVKNVFDQKFNWVTNPFDTIRSRLTPTPSREIRTQFNLNF